jgi:hypothetical protein
MNKFQLPARVAPTQRQRPALSGHVSSPIAREADVSERLNRTFSSLWGGFSPDAKLKTA